MSADPVAKELDQFSLLVNWSPAGLFITDPEGCCTYMNPHAKAICQSDVGASGQPWAQALGVENPNGVMESWSSRAGLEYSGIFRVCRPDSASRWIEVRTVPVECSSGALAGHSGIVQDISERWTSDRRIAARDAITRILADAESAGSACRAILGEIGEILGLSMGLFWEIDSESRALHVTAVWPGSGSDFPAVEAAVRETGFPPGVGLPGRVWADRKPAWISDVTLDGNFPRAQAAAQDGLHGAFAFPITAGGEIFGVMEFFSRAVWGKDPQLLEVFAVLGSQIGQFLYRKRRETDLRRSEEMFWRVAQNIGEVLWIGDPASKRLVYISPACELIWGRTGEALLSDASSFLDTVHPSDRYRVTAFRDRAFRGIKVEEGYRIIRPDGAISWIRDLAFPVRNEAGSLGHIVGLGVDITERVRREQQRSQAAKAEALGVLAGGLAHDFNNLLTSILGNASIALDTVADGHPATPLIQNVISSSERAATLVSQMLAYSGKGRFFNEFVDLSRLADDFLKDVTDSIPASIQLRSDLASGLPCVEADRHQIRQMVGNLYLNALEAIGDAPGQVTVTTGFDAIDPEACGGSGDGPDSSGEFVYLRVADTGCGIDDAIRSRIFDPFFTTKFIGRGLGLSAVQGIVHAHSGSIRVSSQPGEGAAFTCLLPVVRHNGGM
ncbi:MAG TPA: ATP-binding protein [Candidatus Limnocylindrales bacterium]|nr:ATP-binding protein [Candidatus Limnocylindrales bacterium]